MSDLLTWLDPCPKPNGSRLHAQTGGTTRDWLQPSPIKSGNDSELKPADWLSGAASNEGAYLSHSERQRTELAPLQSFGNAAEWLKPQEGEAFPHGSKTTQNRTLSTTEFGSDRKSQLLSPKENTGKTWGQAGTGKSRSQTAILQDRMPDARQNASNAFSLCQSKGGSQADATQNRIPSLINDRSNRSDGGRANPNADESFTLYPGDTHKTQTVSDSDSDVSVASSREHGGAEDLSGNDGWSCPRCSFENSILLPHCEMCEAPRLAAECLFCSFINRDESTCCEACEAPLQHIGNRSNHEEKLWLDRYQKHRRKVQKRQRQKERRKQLSGSSTRVDEYGQKELTPPVRTQGYPGRRGDDLLEIAMKDGTPEKGIPVFGKIGQPDLQQAPKESLRSNPGDTATAADADGDGDDDDDDEVRLTEKLVIQDELDEKQENAETDKEHILGDSKEMDREDDDTEESSDESMEESSEDSTGENTEESAQEDAIVDTKDENDKEEKQIPQPMPGPRPVPSRRALPPCPLPVQKQQVNWQDKVANDVNVDDDEEQQEEQEEGDEASATISKNQLRKQKKLLKAQQLKEARQAEAEEKERLKKERRKVQAQSPQGACQPKLDDGEAVERSASDMKAPSKEHATGAVARLDKSARRSHGPKQTRKHLSEKNTTSITGKMNKSDGKTNHASPVADSTDQKNATDSNEARKQRWLEKLVEQQKEAQAAHKIKTGETMNNEGETTHVSLPGDKEGKTVAVKQPERPKDALAPLAANGPRVMTPAEEAIEAARHQVAHEAHKRWLERRRAAEDAAARAAAKPSEAVNSTAVRRIETHHGGAASSPADPISKPMHGKKEANVEAVVQTSPLSRGARRAQQAAKLREEKAAARMQNQQEEAATRKQNPQLRGDGALCGNTVLIAHFPPKMEPSPAEMDAAKKLRVQGQAEFRKQNVRAALTLFSEALLRDPGDGLLFHCRARCWQTLGRYVEALDDATACTEIEPLMAEGWAQRAKAEIALCRYRDARESLERGRQADPSDREWRKQQDLIAGKDFPLELMQKPPPELELQALMSALHINGLQEEDVQRHAALVNAQLQFLTQILNADIFVLETEPWALRIYSETVSLVSLLFGDAAAAASQLPAAKAAVSGLGLGLRLGWNFDREVSKVTAHALCMLISSNDANHELRVLAVHNLLSGLIRWLVVDSPPPGDEDPGEEGGWCNCTQARRCAACSVAMLLDMARSVHWLPAELAAYPDLEQLVCWLIVAVRDAHGQPLGLPMLLSYPAVAKRIMHCAISVENYEHTFPNKDEAEEIFGDAAGSSSSSSQKGGKARRHGKRARVDHFAPPLPEPTRDAPRHVRENYENEMARRRDYQKYLRSLPDLRVPRQRLGDWVINSLAYLVTVIRFDGNFVNVACDALMALADASEDGLERLQCAFMALPLIQRLSSLSMHYNGALKLLQYLGRDSSARLAMRSLAVALIGDNHDLGIPVVDSPVWVKEVKPLGQNHGLGGILADSDQDIWTTWSGTFQEALYSWALRQRGSQVEFLQLRNFSKASGNISTGAVTRWPLGAITDADAGWALLEVARLAAADGGDAETEKQLNAVLQSLVGKLQLPAKRVWFERQLYRHHHDGLDDGEEEEQISYVECDRDSDILEALRRQLRGGVGLGGKLTGIFEIRFVGETSTGSAVMREWVDFIAGAFMNPKYRLLTSFDHRRTFRPDPLAPFVNPCWRLDFQLLGRLLGLAVYHHVPVPIRFHPQMCRLLLEQNVPWEDWTPEEVKEINPDLYAHKIRWLLDQPDDWDPSELGIDLLFTDVLNSSVSETAGGSEIQSTQSSRSLPAVVDPQLDVLPGKAMGDAPQFLGFQEVQEVALCRGGETRVVADSESRLEYTKLLAHWWLFGSVALQAEAMLQGLESVVPRSLLPELRRIVTSDEFSILISGVPTIEVDDWEAHTHYAGGLTESSNIVRWFWRCVQDWAEAGEEDRLRDLLQFATGARCVPVGGFGHLRGFAGGLHRFTLNHGAHLTPQSLPTAHACVCTIDLPPYADYSVLKGKLTLAIDMGAQAFGSDT